MTEKELEKWRSCQYRMGEEGFDYCFNGYGDFSEIEDEKFHELRKMYLSAAKNLEDYVNEKTETI